MKTFTPRKDFYINATGNDALLHIRLADGAAKQPVQKNKKKLAQRSFRER